MEGNKYKLLMKIPLTDLEIVKGKILIICVFHYLHYLLYTKLFFFFNINIEMYTF